jgi:hypothetical protein
MRIGVGAVLTILHLGIVGIAGSAAAHAQTITGSATIALKSGESAEVGDLYFVTNCRSILKGTPDVEILDGPPGISVAIKAAMVTPRAQRCSNQVPGGKLVISADKDRGPKLHPTHDSDHLPHSRWRSEVRFGLQSFAVSMRTDDTAQRDTNGLQLGGLGSRSCEFDCHHASLAFVSAPSSCSTA